MEYPSSVDLRDPVQKYSKAFATEEDLAIAEAVHEFVDREVMPRRLDLDGGFHRDRELAEKTFHQIRKGLVDLGWQRAWFPKEYGGLGIDSSVTYSIFTEELSRGDPDIAEHFGTAVWGLQAAMLVNNETVLKRFAPIFCGSEVCDGCFAMTEPAGGCNVEDVYCQHGRTIQTRAELKGNEWIVNGQKLWPGPIIDSIIYSTVCTIDPEKGDDGIVIIDVPKDTRGLSFGKPEELMGRSCTAKNGAIFYDDVRVPKEYCSGLPGGQGAWVIKHMVSSRFDSAPEALGPAQACLEIAIDYLKDRYIVGKPVRDRSLIAATIGEMAMKIQAARSYYLNVAYMFDHPEIYGDTISLQQLARSSGCKNFATEVAEWVCRQAMGLMGSYGYSTGGHVEKYLRDLPIIRLWMAGVHGAMLDTARGEYAFKSW
jgi:alkylation response protein AidB-like acyl-CoA dehydrogenase